MPPQVTLADIQRLEQQMWEESRATRTMELERTLALYERLRARDARPQIRIISPAQARQEYGLDL